MSRSALLLAVCALALLACTGAPSNTPTPAASRPATPAPTAAPATPTPAPATPSHAPVATPTLRVTPAPSATPVATPTSVASPSAPPSLYPAGSVIVTFKVDDEKFRVLVVDPANIEIAHKLLAGRNAPRIPNGLVVRGDPSVNVGWSWHIDPDSLEFADITTEVCDGLPSFVEDDQITGDRFCPWSAKVIAVDPANS